MSAPETARVVDSGMGAEPLALDGAVISAGMTWIDAPAEASDGPEEMVALLEGAALLISGPDRYALSAGQGVLIPAGAPRRWEPACRALIYRVRLRG